MAADCICCRCEKWGALTGDGRGKGCVQRGAWGRGAASAVRMAATRSLVLRILQHGCCCIRWPAWRLLHCRLVDAAAYYGRRRTLAFCSISCCVGEAMQQTVTGAKLVKVAASPVLRVAGADAAAGLSVLHPLAHIIVVSAEVGRFRIWMSVRCEERGEKQRAELL